MIGQEGTKKKRIDNMKKLIMDMITTHVGSISSKIVVGALCYILITVALLVLMFVNPSFPGLSEILSVLIITSASLLGLTTIENIKQIPGKTGGSKPNYRKGGVDGEVPENID